jgi:hypothetical protein
MTWNNQRFIRYRSIPFYRQVRCIRHKSVYEEDQIHRDDSQNMYMATYLKGTDYSNERSDRQR